MANDLPSSEGDFVNTRRYKSTQAGARTRRYAGSQLFRFAHERLVRAYCRSPSAGRDRAVSAWQGLRSVGSWLLHDESAHLQCWRGQTAAGADLNVLFAGNWRAFDERSPQYLQRLLFTGGEFLCEEAGQLRSAAHLREQAAGADLVITERNRFDRFRPDRGCWLRAPVWVRQVFTIQPGETWDSLLQRLRSQKRNLRLIRRNQFTYRICRDDEAAFDLFYDHMHLPLINSRHGAYGTVSSREVLREQYRHGMILQVLSPEGQAVAADLLVAHDAVLFNVAGGVLDADRGWYERGVLSALYYYEIEWAHQNRFRMLDSGESRPMHSDGVYAHKLRWGMQSISDWREANEWLFWLPKCSLAARSWLDALQFDAQFARWGGGPTVSGEDDPQGTGRR